jgi:hypothetical protein
MKTRPLQTESPLIRATSAQDVSVGLMPGLRELATQPFTGGLLRRQFQMSGATSEAISDDARQAFREAERERRTQTALLERDLIWETDPVRSEQIRSQLTSIEEESTFQRESIFQEAVEAGRLLEPEQVEEQYGITATRLMSPAEAELIVRGRKEEEIRNAIVAAGPQGIIPTGARFVTSLLTTATDPVELGSMFIPIVGPARSAALVARFGPVGGRAAIGATEGAVGSLLTEPLYYGLSQSQQLDYTMQDALFNVTAGLFIGGGIGTGIGFFSRRQLNYSEINNAARPDTQVISGRPIDFEPPPSAPARAIDDVQTRQTFRDVNYEFMGGRFPSEAAIRMMANDVSVNAALTAPRAVPRPQTLSEFVRESGGVNLNDPNLRAQAERLRSEGIDLDEAARLAQEGGVATPTGINTLDDMARLAQREGFIESADSAALLRAVRQEAEGTFVFRQKDVERADIWRGFHRAGNDIEAELMRRQNIREELEAIGYRNPTEEEVSLLSSGMATGRSLDEAAAQIGIPAEGLRAAAIARQSGNKANDPLSDFEASMRADRTPDEMDFEAAMVREQEILRQMELDGTLTPSQRAALDAIRLIDERADTYIEAVQAAALCVTRS